MDTLFEQHRFDMIDMITKKYYFTIDAVMETGIEDLCFYCTEEILESSSILYELFCYDIIFFKKA